MIADAAVRFGPLAAASVIYDAVVIGAGPGGSIAALTLARLGARVALIERGALGRDKPCGGGLTPRAWENLEVDVEDIVALRTPHIRVRAGDRVDARLDLADRPVVLVRRRDFDRRLAEAARDSGAELRLATSATAIAQDRDIVSVGIAPGESLRCRAVVIAAGAESKLAPGLRMPSRRRQYAVAVELEGPMAVRTFAHDELVFDYSIPGGYAWAFPKGLWWNVGALSVRPEIAQTLRRRLVRFMDRHGIRPEGGDVAPSRVTGRRIPLWSSPLPAVVGGRMAVVGDAAGLADPFFGEGIAQALESGRLAAAAVAAMLAGTAADLSPYADCWATRTGRHLHRMELLSRLVYSAPEPSVRLLAAFAPLRRAVAGLTAEPLIQ